MTWFRASLAHSPVQTAKAVASRHQCLPIQISASLRERHYGSLQGHPYPDDEVMPDDMEPLEAYVAASCQRTLTSPDWTSVLRPGWRQF